ncbi:MAG TPA: bifunctional glutamate N-acetyltransferase/amino-acid acetyltransferase ArgJ [Chloroflexota bacterium]|nr:bifunctional glutamate N-acetyltransferase/amino-acid acetyltransferase ArgJ [Chloroflexota bacterium]
MIRAIQGGLLAPRGWLAAGTCAHVKGSTGDKLDVGLLASEFDCAAAGVFTRNQFKAAPVRWCQKLLPSHSIRAVVADSGNANACTGDQGDHDAEQMAQVAAELLGVQPGQVLVGSTGVIGIPMPMERIGPAIRTLRLGPYGDAFNDAIMTTDTKRKQCSVAFDVAGREVRLGGVSKGVAMMHPNMATMLCFVTSDAIVEPDLLPGALKQAADASFNMLSIDGDQSTNDTLIVLCNGAAGNAPIRAGTAEATLLGQAIQQVCLDLARKMAADAEGGTKVIEVRVRGAANDADAQLAARTIASSTLLKCAVHGNDPNWGRILMALGNSPVHLDTRRVSTTIRGFRMMEAGAPVPFDAAAASKAMDAPVVDIEVELGIGRGEGLAIGCDMSEEYVTLNADYTT